MTYLLATIQIVLKNSNHRYNHTLQLLSVRRHNRLQLDANPGGIEPCHLAKAHKPEHVCAEKVAGRTTASREGGLDVVARPVNDNVNAVYVSALRGQDLTLNDGEVLERFLSAEPRLYLG